MQALDAKTVFILFLHLYKILQNTTTASDTRLYEHLLEYTLQIIYDVITKRMDRRKMLDRRGLAVVQKTIVRAPAHDIGAGVVAAESENTRHRNE